MPHKTFEQWLEEVGPQQHREAIFKVFLGYAPGVGKTLTMLSEGIRRHSRGEDAVIGVLETHGGKPIAKLAEKLEQVPRPAGSNTRERLSRRWTLMPASPASPRLQWWTNWRTYCLAGGASSDHVIAVSTAIVG